MAAIALAEASIGDYKLKSSPDYEVGETDTRSSGYGKRPQTLNCHLAIGGRLIHVNYIRRGW